MAVNDVLEWMLTRGWPLTKAAYLAAMYHPEDPDFPLDGEICARVPSWLPGRMPGSFGDLLSAYVVPRRPKGPLTLMREKGWPWTKAAYVKALYFPRKPDFDDLRVLEALAVWVPPNLPGDLPDSTKDLALRNAPPEAHALAKRIRWPSARAVEVAMYTRECGKDEAIVELLAQDGLVKRVMRECKLSREDAAIAVTRVEPIAEPLMSRHGFTKDVAIIELIRGGA